MREKFGDKTRFLLCSELPQTGIRDVLGLRNSGSTFSSSSSSSSISDAGYSVSRAAVSAAMDEMEERVLWDKWKIV